ncbi:MAG: UDP-N-acetylmuramoyl-L-alanyl-D-glutamate--2,6-diaminopimelate ligase [Candidatus Dormibacteria bacterium]
MRWSELSVPFGPPGAGDIGVEGVIYDSRLAGPGQIFVAIRGVHRDGHDFVRAALAGGSPAAVVERRIEGVPGEPLVVVADSRIALAQLAAAIHGHPSRALPVIGVTGTDGKTSTTTMLRSALAPSLGRVGSLTTVDFRIGDEIEPNLSRQTTLEAPEIQDRLRRMVDRGCRAVALESTSHGLALHRLDEIDFAGAVFTNITHEHLDFHKTWEAYFEAKASLLDRTTQGGGFAVLNRDDPLAFGRLRERAPARVLTYSAAGHADADLRAGPPLMEGMGLTFRATTPAGEATVRLGMAGRWNVANALAALAAGLLLDQPLEQLVQGLGNLAAIPGRMETVDLGQPFSVIVDYAHTPAALTLILYELRSATPARLWVVFGSAGERDRAKRAEMGRIAARLADQVVVTSEDPRGEDPEAIIDEICRGAMEVGAEEGNNLHRLTDRVEAIQLAIHSALPGDTVLLAGKGHERSILLNAGSIPWDERAVAEAALRARGGRAGD